MSSATTAVERVTSPETATAGEDPDLVAETETEDAIEEDGEADRTPEIGIEIEEEKMIEEEIEIEEDLETEAMRIVGEMTLEAIATTETVGTEETSMMTEEERGETRETIVMDRTDLTLQNTKRETVMTSEVVEATDLEVEVVEATDLEVEVVTVKVMTEEATPLHAAMVAVMMVTTRGTSQASSVTMMMAITPRPMPTTVVTRCQT